MHVEKHETYLGNVLRKIKKEEVNLTFQNHRKGMLKQNVQRMENP
jgi:hypothetical protein